MMNNKITHPLRVTKSEIDTFGIKKTNTLPNGCVESKHSYRTTNQWSEICQHKNANKPHFNLNWYVYNYQVSLRHFVSNPLSVYFCMLGQGQGLLQYSDSARVRLARL